MRSCRPSDVPALPPPGLTLVQGVMDEGWNCVLEWLETGDWN